MNDTLKLRLYRKKVQLYVGRLKKLEAEMQQKLRGVHETYGYKHVDDFIDAVRVANGEGIKVALPANGQSGHHNRYGTKRCYVTRALAKAVREHMERVTGSTLKTTGAKFGMNPGTVFKIKHGYNGRHG